MDNRNQIAIREDDVFVATGTGVSELQDSQTSLSADELELMVLVDGRKTVGEIAPRVRNAKPGAVEGIFRALLSRGMVAFAEKGDSDSLDFSGFFSAKASPAPGAIAAAGQEADQGSSYLQTQGYYVRIARAARQKRVPVKGEKLSVLIVEDETHLAKLLKTFLALEGFDARIAASRSEIVAELRRPPRPDLVLLDVMLPDADGFDILAAIRRHPVLAAVPTVMLTSKSTREAVLKGLAGGADGYITKPFEVDVLLKAVRTVLGLTA